MKRILVLATALALAACGPPPAPAADAPFTLRPALGVGAADPCIPEGRTREELATLKAQEFEVREATDRHALALALTRCLASPDPVLRDGIAFEALAKWMRADALDEATRRALIENLVPRLMSVEQHGVEAPFAALVLAEVARTDRIAPWMLPEERNQLVTQAVAFETGVRDYRGFDAGQGWRHGVAHGADLLLQLALNPALTPEQRTQVRTAVASQVAPKGHAYVFGEPDRLARPILALASRGAFAEADWTQWLAQVSGPGDLGSWDKAFTSTDGLARLHDVRAFLYALHANVTAGSDPADEVMKPGLEAALKTLP